MNVRQREAHVTAREREIQGYRRKAVKEARRLLGIFDGTRNFVIETWILKYLLEDYDERLKEED